MLNFLRPNQISFKSVTKVSLTVVYNKVLSRSMIASNTKLSSMQIIMVKDMLFSINQAHRLKPITTANDFLVAHAENIKSGNKLYQHLLHVIYPKIQFDKQSIQEKFPDVRIEFTTKSYYTLADLINIITAKEIQQHPELDPTQLTVRVTDRVLVNNSSNALARLNTGQDNPDFQVTHILGHWTRFYDEKKGDTWSPFSGHFILSSEQDIEIIAKRMLFAQLTSIKVYNLNHKNSLKIFQTKLEQVLKDKNLSWKNKTECMNDFYVTHMTYFPQNMTPSMVFEITKPIRFSMMSDDIRARLKAKMLANCCSFENIRNTENAVVTSMQGQKTRSNLHNSSGVSPNIKKMLREIMAEQFEELLKPMVSFNNSNDVLF